MLNRLFNLGMLQCEYGPPPTTTIQAAYGVPSPSTAELFLAR